jgi:hypothetical protein
MAENEEIKALEVKSEATEEAPEVKNENEVAVKEPAKEFSALSDRDLLIELLKEQKKTSRRSLITAASLVAICLIIGVAVLVIVPKVVDTLSNAYKAIDNIQTVVVNANKAIDSVETSLDGLDVMIKNIDKVVVDNTDSVGKAVDRVSNIDIATLNKSIKDLSEIIEPLAKFFRR